MNQFTLFTCLVLMSISTFAQTKTAQTSSTENEQYQRFLKEQHTSSCIFNDTLWFVNEEGFQYVALNSEESFEPIPVYNHAIRYADEVFKTDSYLWVIRNSELIRYDGKTTNVYQFPKENFGRISRFNAISDDSLSFSITYAKPEYRTDKLTPIAVQDVLWTKGSFKDHEYIKREKKYITKNGDYYLVYPFKIIYKSTTGIEAQVELTNSMHAVQKAWISPDDKLWIQQQNQGFSIIKKATVIEQIPFYFKKSRFIDIENLFFMENNTVVAISDELYAYYIKGSWYEFSMPYTINVEQYKNKLFFIRYNELAYQEIN